MIDFRRIKIKVHPNKQDTKIRPSQSREDVDMEIDLKANAEENKANRELIGFLAKYFEIPKNSVKIVGGLKSRIKTVEIGLDGR